MKILITGAAGFVGSHIVRQLASESYDVIAVDVESLPEGCSAAGSIDQRYCDVTDGGRLARLIAEVDPYAVVHAAAITPGEDELSRANEILQVNLMSTMTALLASARTNCARFVYLSSAGVYLDPAAGAALTEESPVNNTGALYAQTKLASERLCAWARRELGLKTVALRVGPVYGEFERPTETRSRMSPVHRAISIVRAGEIISCNAPDSLYNWIHGDDVGKAISLAIRSRNPRAVYNLAGPPVSVRETLASVADLLPAARVEWTTHPESASLRLTETSRPVSSSFIATDLGFGVDVDLREGLRRLVDDLKEVEG